MGLDAAPDSMQAEVRDLDRRLECVRDAIVSLADAAERRTEDEAKCAENDGQVLNAKKELERVQQVCYNFKFRDR